MYCYRYMLLEARGRGERPIRVGRSGGNRWRAVRQKRSSVGSRSASCQHCAVSALVRVFVSRVFLFTTTSFYIRPCDVEQNNSRAKEHWYEKSSHALTKGGGEREKKLRRQLRSTWRAVDFRAIPSREVHRCDAINKATSRGGLVPLRVRRRRFWIRALASESLRVFAHVYSLTFELCIRDAITLSGESKQSTRDIECRIYEDESGFGKVIYSVNSDRRWRLLVSDLWQKREKRRRRITRIGGD